MSEKEISIELVSLTPDPEKVIERAGRTCYLSFDKATEESASAFIKARIKTGHDSILEHATASFVIKGVSRAFSHQLVRHRIASFSQQSQRYVDEVDFGYIVPPSIKADIEAYRSYLAFMGLIANEYAFLRSRNILKEDARFILPNACETEIFVTMNFREFRNAIKLRVHKHAQWEIRNIFIEITKQLAEIAPAVFSDLLEGIE